MFGISSFAAAPYASLAGTTFYGNASITGTATVAAAGIRVQTGIGSISGTATVTAVGIRVQNVSASVNGTATVTVAGIRIQNAAGSINGIADVSCPADIGHYYFYVY